MSSTRRKIAWCTNTTATPDCFCCCNIYMYCCSASHSSACLSRFLRRGSCSHRIRFHTDIADKFRSFEVELDLLTTKRLGTWAVRQVTRVTCSSGPHVLHYLPSYTGNYMFVYMHIIATHAGFSRENSSSMTGNFRKPAWYQLQWLIGF